MNLNRYNQGSNIINNILKYGSFVLVFVLPLFVLTNVTYIYISPKIYLLYAIVDILTAFWVYALITDKSYRLNKKTLLYFIPLFCFIIWMTISGILGANPHLSFWSSLGRGTGLLTLYHSLAFSLIVASLIKHNGTDYLYKLIKWIINGGFILAISVWVGDQGFNLFDFFKKSAGGGLMGNSSLTAAYLLLVLAFCFFLLTSKNKINNKWLLIVKIAVILFSPLFIDVLGFFNGLGVFGVARGATLGFIISIFVAGIFYLFISKKKIFRILGIVGIFIGIGIFSFTWVQLVTPESKLYDKFVEAASGTRLVFWNVAQESMNEHPWFGYGPENYTLAFQEHFYPKISDDEYGHEGWTDRAHNVYYDTGVSGGYPSLIFYGVFLFSILYGLYKLKDSEKISHIQISVLGGLLIGYIFQNLFVFDSLNSIMILFLLAGVVFTLQSNTNEEKIIIKPINLVLKNSIIVLLFIISSTALVFFVFRPAIKDFTYYRVINMPLDLRAFHYVDWYGGSQVGEDLDVGLMANNLYELYSADPMKLKNDSKLLPLIVGDIKGFLGYAEVVLARNKPVDVRLDVGVVYLYNTLNFFTDKPYDPILADHMFSLLNNAESIAPKNPQIYRAMAQVYVWKNDLKGVADVYQKMISLDPRIVSSHIRLIKFAEITKNQKLYNEAIIQSEKDIPGFIEKYKQALNLTTK